MSTRVRDVAVGQRILRVDFELFDEQMACLDRLATTLGPEESAALEGIWELLAECRACWADAMGREGDAVVYGLEISDV
jgi:hypothetical protein